MAYLVDEEDKQQEDKEGQAGPASQGQILSSPGAAPIGAGQAATAAAGPATPKGTSSGSFTNLRAYIGANQGNDQAMGQAIGGTIQNSANSADEAGTSFKDASASQIGAATVRDAGGLTNTFKSLTTPATLPQTTPTATRAFSPTDGSKAGRGSFQADMAPAKSSVRSPVTPAAPTSAPRLAGTSAEDFTKLYNASYSGPTRDTLVNQSGYGDTAAAYNKINNLAGMATGAKADMGSRGQLLNETYAKDGKQYRGGERTLDSFILGAGDQGLAEMEKIGKQYGDYGSKFDGILGMLGEQANTAAGETDATRNAFREAVTQAQTGLTGRLDSAQAQADEANRAYEDRYKQLSQGDSKAWNDFDLTKYAQGGDYSNKQLLSLLMNGVENVPAVNLNSLLVQPAERETMANYAADGDEGDYQQLLQLIGGAGGDASSKYKQSAFKNGSLGAIGLNEDAVRGALDPLVAEALRQSNLASAAGKNLSGSYSAANAFGADDPADALMASLGTSVQSNANASKKKQLMDKFRNPIKDDKNKDMNSLYSSSTGVKVK